jgi:hypothetical protein
MATKSPAVAVSDGLCFFSSRLAHKQLPYLQKSEDQGLKEFLSSFLEGRDENEVVRIYCKTELGQLYDAFCRVRVITEKAFREWPFFSDADGTLMSQSDVKTRKSKCNL